MKNTYKALSNNKFAKNVAVVASGTTGAQAITFVFTPFITRLYGPEPFGLLGVFVALTAILAPISALTFPTAIVIAKDNHDARRLASLSLLIALAFSLTLAFSLLVFGETLLNFIGAKSIGAYALFIPVCVFFSSLTQIIQQHFARLKYFNIISKAKIAQALIVNSAKTVFGLFVPTTTMLILITTLGAILHALLIGRQGALSTKENTDNHVTSSQPQKKYKELLKEYYEFPLFQAPQQLLNALSLSIPVLMLSTLFDPVIAGFYALARLVLAAPSMLISNSIGEAFLPHFYDAKRRKENLSIMLTKATAALAAIGVLPYAIIIWVGPDMFAFLFGQNWEIAGEYARWMAIWLFFSFLNPPSVKAVIVLRVQMISLILNIATLLLRLGGLFIGAWIFKSALVAIILFSAGGALHNIVFIYIAWKKSKEKCT